MWWWYGFPSLKITLTFLLLIITEKLQYYLLQGRSLSPRFVQTYALLYNFFPEDLRREAGVISNCIQVNASSIRMSFRIKRNTVDRSAVKISPRRESQLMALKHFHKGFPVWVENVYEEKSSQYRASLLPQNYCTMRQWESHDGAQHKRVESRHERVPWEHSHRLRPVWRQRLLCRGAN